MNKSEVGWGAEKRLRMTCGRVGPSVLKRLWRLSVGCGRPALLDFWRSRNMRAYTLSSVKYHRINTQRGSCFAVTYL